jgi:predicted nucleotidyltransferase
VQSLGHLTPEQEQIVRSASAVLAADGEVAAAWLAGSLGRGAGDAFSDVDLLVLVTAGDPSDVGRRYAACIASIAPPALANPLFGGRVVNVVTEDWRRFDLSFIKADELARYNAAQLVQLFNKGALAPPIREEEPYAPSPDVVLGLVNEFLRVIGLSVVAVGREEWLLAQWGADILRRLTMDLMLEENAVSPAERGGALRRRPLLTADQFSALANMRPVTPDLEGVLVSNRELAAIFLPRARALSQRIGAPWPSTFERATREHLRTNLGLELP